MKFCLTLIGSLFFASHLFAASVSPDKPAKACGLMQAGVTKDLTFYVNVADRLSVPQEQVNFKVTNYLDFEWLAGTCVCLRGEISADPDQGEDSNFRLIKVSTSFVEDLAGKACLPKEGK
jgi:hypothetical protein